MARQGDGELSGSRGGCPRWCVADHEMHEALEDQWHESTTWVVPVIEVDGLFTSYGWRLDSTGVTIDIIIEQHVSAETATIAFGEGDDRARNFRLTVESAERFLIALHSAVHMTK